ncbi:MAG: glycogen synthase GlgA [Candidatus Omnitrophica bacterium]|nr:glycogen synthase GlgA [Candidatus Omnitrophota bacterium]MDD5724689.1 glycogen synthase GlgA [Candidatus Omnitrophota bacterium]
MKIAMFSSEVVPFAKTGGLADVAGALPLALEYCGHEVIVVMPAYRCVGEAKLKISRVSEGVTSSIIGKGVRVFFIENKPYFDRPGLYGNENGDYPDNLERFSFFCRRALESLKEIKFGPDILHLHDWQASLAAVYLKTLCSKDVFYKKIHSVLTIHNIGYQGIFAKEEFPKLGLDWGLFDIETFEFFNKVNLLKGGISMADFISTVSQTYAKEIQTPDLGFGLDGLLRKRRNVLSGILNGLDYSVWDPDTDRFITQNFSQAHPGDKALDKADLQKICGLRRDKDVPLFGMVSRLAEQKGLDILGGSLDEFCGTGAQLVILGTGDLKYHELLKKFSLKYPKSISLNLKFDDSLAHKIYAGSDIFLMPSRYEPCGLGQMISLRYGTIPVVFKTGGLADTVNRNNGFVFSSYRKEDLMKSVHKAVSAFGDKDKWASLVDNAMRCNFSWKVSADKYIQLYAKAKKK